MENVHKNVFLRVCMGLFMVAGLLTACSDKNTPAADSAVQTGDAAHAALPGTTHVVIGIDAHSAPMSFWNLTTNTLVGYDIDLAKEACRRAEWECEFKPIVWAEKEDDLLKRKTIDAIWSSLTISDERRKIFAFSTPYIRNRQAIMVRADSPIRTRSDLGGKVVVLNAGGIAVPLVRQLSGAEAPAKIDELEQKVDLFVAVLEGKADAAVNDSIAMEYYAANSPGKFRILEESLQEEEFGVAVRPQDTAMLEKINKALADMQADGTEQAIRRKWFD